MITQLQLNKYYYSYYYYYGEGEGEVHTRFGVGNLRVRDHFEDLGIGYSIILKWIFKNLDGEAWSGLIWLRIRTGGGRL